MTPTARRHPLSAGRAGRSALLAVLFLALLAPPASAHPDTEVDAGTHMILAGESHTIPAEWHYHRLVGHVRADDADAAVVVLVAGSDGERVVAGPGADLKVNALDPCCKGTYLLERTVRIANEGVRDVEVDLRLVLLHDGIAVTNDNAESGSLAFAVLVPAAFAIGWGRLLPRRVTDGRGDARQWTRAAAGTHGAVWLASAALGGWGMLRYGGGPVAGTLAATADLPATGGTYLNTHAVLLLVLNAAWLTSLGLWTAAARRATEDRRRVALLGIAIGCTSTLACAAWAIEYGTLLAPLLTLIPAASLPFAGGVWLLRQEARGKEKGKVLEASLPPT